MTEQRRVPWGPKPERPPGPIMQNVRIGDRLGVRYTGAGAHFNLTDEFHKGKTLGSPTFEAIYYKSVLSGETTFLKFNPNGTIESLRVVFGAPVEQDFYVDPVPEVRIEENQEFDAEEEFVVIPSFAFTTPALLSMLPKSTIEEEMYQARYSDLDAGKPDIWDIDTR